MRLVIIAVAGLFIASAATGQTTTTNCTGYGTSLHCTSQTQPGVDWGAFAQQQQQLQQQNQQNMNQAFQNLGAAIAARRERSREKKEAAAAAATQAVMQAQLNAALATELPAAPPPTDESPVQLACTVRESPATIALYERHGRVDVTSNGVTRTRAATFTANTITWTSPIGRSSLSRLDGSLVFEATLPAFVGETQTGTCSVAQPKF